MQLEPTAGTRGGSRTARELPPCAAAHRRRGDPSAPGRGSGSPAAPRPPPTARRSPPVPRSPAPPAARSPAPARRPREPGAGAVACARRERAANAANCRLVAHPSARCTAASMRSDDSAGDSRVISSTASSGENRNSAKRISPTCAARPHPIDRELRLRRDMRTTRSQPGRCRTKCDTDSTTNSSPSTRWKSSMTSTAAGRSSACRSPTS